MECGIGLTKQRRKRLVEVEVIPLFHHVKCVALWRVTQRYAAAGWRICKLDRSGRSDPARAERDDGRGWVKRRIPGDADRDTGLLLDASRRNRAEGERLTEQRANSGPQH